jgi:hypothetical protein
MENVEIEQALGEFRPRSEVYLQGGVGEPLVLRELLRAHPATLEGVRLTSCLLPQMNEFDYAAHSPCTDLMVFLDSRAHRLVAIAAPGHRGRLAAAWAEMRRGL